jgi:hypothetical protein
MLKEPPGGLATQDLDLAANERAWRSGVRLERLMTGKIIRKLLPGDLIIYSNPTWAHAANNWHPDTGVRRIAAAFA